MRILIAEDDSTLRTILTTMLETLGHDVVVTIDGAEAWDAMQQPDAPGLAILDWNMPRMTGVDVCRRIRAVNTSEPPYLILLTVHKEKGHIVTGLDAGANDYMIKPYDHDELRARVDVGARMLELQSALAGKVKELKKALDDVKTLRGIVPICASCKKIRDDKGFWQQVERYVATHTEAQFTHGVCPDCFKKFYPDYIVAPAESDCGCNASERIRIDCSLS